MKLPVKPKGDRDIIDDDNAFVCFANTTKDRDQIIKAINSHKKFKEALDEIKAVSCGEKQIESDGVYDDSDGMLWIYKRIQVLGEIKSNEDSNTK